jgi:hypothetical protein
MVWGPKRVQATDARTFEFYEPNGHPRVWYHKSPSGKYEFFDRMRYAPNSGEPLAPIDGRIVQGAIRLQNARAAAPQDAEVF